MGIQIRYTIWIPIDYFVDVPLNECPLYMYVAIDLRCSHVQVRVHMVYWHSNSIDREQKNTENPRFRVLMHFRTNRFTCKKIHLRLHDYTLTIDYLNTLRLFRRCALKRMSFRYVRGHWFKVLACASPSPYSFWAFKYDRLQHVPTTRQIR